MRFMLWLSSSNRIDPPKADAGSLNQYPGGRRGPYPSPYHQNVQSLLDMLKRLVNGTN
jgi:hypothetical protein